MSKLLTVNCKLLTALFSLLPLAVFAQRDNLFTLDAQLRTRAEYNNGAGTLRYNGEEPAFYVNNRTRLTADYQRKNLELRAAAQHTGIWGDNDINKTAGNLSLNEAWAKIRTTQGLFFQVGRMPLAYDDERLLGAADWNVAGNWHDALRVGFENTTHQLHLFATYLQHADNIRGGYYADVMPYKQMQGLWYHLQILPENPLGISAIAINTGYENGTQQHGKSLYMQTMGAYINWQPLNFQITAEGYYQRGKTDISGTLYNVSAFMAAARIAYTVPRIIRLQAGYDYLSGNDGLNVNEHAFNPLFGSYHKFFGAMDFFTGRAGYGLQDINADITAYLPRNINIDIQYHNIRMAETLHFVDLHPKLGQEIDLSVTAPVIPNVTLQAGYSTIFATPTLDVLKNGDHTRWHDFAYITLNINPRLFITNW